VSKLEWIGCELYNLGSYWIFLLWIMDVDPFPRIRAVQLEDPGGSGSGPTKSTFTKEVQSVLSGIQAFTI
jgi:hypothetical protein